MLFTDINLFHSSLKRSTLQYLPASRSIFDALQDRNLFDKPSNHPVNDKSGISKYQSLYEIFTDQRILKVLLFTLSGLYAGPNKQTVIANFHVFYSPLQNFSVFDKSIRHVYWIPEPLNQHILVTKFSTKMIKC